MPRNKPAKTCGNTFDSLVLDCIFSKCTSKTLASLQCVSTQFREVAQDVMRRSGRLSLSCTPGTFREQMHWIRDAKERVVRLHTSQIGLYMIPLHSLPNLEVLTIRRVRVNYRNMWKLRCLPKLKKLELQKLTRTFDQTDRFLLSTLPDSLEQASLAFDDMWNAVVVDQCKNLRRLYISCVKGTHLRQTFVYVQDVGNLHSLFIRASDKIGVNVPETAVNRIQHLTIHSPTATHANQLLRLVGPELRFVDLHLPKVIELYWVLPLVHTMRLQAKSVVLDTSDTGKLHNLHAFGSWISFQPLPNTAKVYIVGCVLTPNQYAQHVQEEFGEPWNT